MKQRNDNSQYGHIQFCFVKATLTCKNAVCNPPKMLSGGAFRKLLHVWHIVAHRMLVIVVVSNQLSDFEGSLNAPLRTVFDTFCFVMRCVVIQLRAVTALKTPRWCIQGHSDIWGLRVGCWSATFLRQEKKNYIYCIFFTETARLFFLSNHRC